MKFTDSVEQDADILFDPDEGVFSDFIGERSKGFTSDGRADTAKVIRALLLQANQSIVFLEAELQVSAVLPDL